MRRGRIRRLSDEEVALWRAVAETVQPRHGSILPPLPVLTQPPPPPRPETAPPSPDRAPAPAAKPERPKTPPLAPMERRLKQRITRGRVGIERAIDLHGLSQAAAHGALRGFLYAAQRDGDRLVLVVTGKGRSSHVVVEGRAEPGILRRVVPHWLREADLRAVVLGFEEAGPAHGGVGALYVRLRRARD